MQSGILSNDGSRHLFLLSTFSILTLVIPTYHATFFFSLLSSAPILNPDLVPCTYVRRGMHAWPAMAHGMQDIAGRARAA